MKSDFVSIYTWNAYKEPSITEKKLVTKEEFITLFLKINWLQGTLWSYPTYPYLEEAPKNNLLILDTKTQKALSFKSGVINDFSIYFFVGLGILQKQDKKTFSGTLQLFDTNTDDEEEMIGYINSFFNRDYTSIEALKELVDSHIENVHIEV